MILIQGCTIFYIPDKFLKTRSFILKELIKNPLNLISKYKIFDNLRRSLFEILALIGIIYFSLHSWYVSGSVQYQDIINEIVVLVAIAMPFILNILNYVIFKKEGEKFQKTFAQKIGTVRGAIHQIFISIGTLPFKAYISIKSSSSHIMLQLL